MNRFRCIRYPALVVLATLPLCEMACSRREPPPDPPALTEPTWTRPLLDVRPGWTKPVADAPEPRLEDRDR